MPYYIFKSSVVGLKLRALFNFCFFIHCLNLLVQRFPMTFLEYDLLSIFSRMLTHQYSLDQIHNFFLAGITN